MRTVSSCEKTNATIQNPARMRIALRSLRRRTRIRSRSGEADVLDG
jgi:hypothetical protein